MKLYRRWRPTGEEMFVNDKGDVCTPTTIDTIVEAARDRVRLSDKTGAVLLYEAKTPKALKEFDDLVQSIVGLNRVSVEAARAEVNRQARNHKLPEPFPGLSESSRSILERTHAASAPPASDLEFWSKFEFLAGR